MSLKTHEYSKVMRIQRILIPLSCLLLLASPLKSANDAQKLISISSILKRSNALLQLSTLFAKDDVKRYFNHLSVKGSLLDLCAVSVAVNLRCAFPL
eukprot:IDg4128t1